VWIGQKRKEECGQMKTADGKMEEENCDMARNYLCEKPATSMN